MISPRDADGLLPAPNHPCGVQDDIGPKLAEEHDLASWNADAVKSGNLAPQIESENEKPLTINHDELVKSWQK